MQAHADSLLLPAQAPPREAVAASVQDRRDGREFESSQIRQDARRPINQELGSGPIVVATAWLAFYVVATVHVLVFGH